MSNKKLLLFIVFVALQLAVIGGFFAQRLYTLSTGTQVVLRTVPVDPRDLIRGEYVALRYEISTISQYLSDEKFSVGDTVYVTLEKNSYDDVWRATGVSKNQPTDYSTAIKGKVTSIPKDTPRNVWDRGVSGLGIEYGIERYFVEAGQGKELERRGRLKVFVRVDRSGASVIERAEPTDSRSVDDWRLEDDFEDDETTPMMDLE
ncbi:MAG: GDYXXLXY domain-containing protein [Patescibacteria group bacterium]